MGLYLEVLVGPELPLFSNATQKYDINACLENSLLFAHIQIPMNVTPKTDDFIKSVNAREIRGVPKNMTFQLI